MNYSSLCANPSIRGNYSKTFSFEPNEKRVEDWGSYRYLMTENMENDTVWKAEIFAESTSSG